MKFNFIIISLYVVLFFHPPLPCLAAAPLAATIPPLSNLVSRVAGDAEVFPLVPPGAEAHTYEPKPADLVRLSRAAALFTVGLESERAIAARIAGVNPHLAIVRLDEGLDLIPYPDRAHACSDRCVHGAGAADPHVWLSPRRMAAMGDKVAATLARLDPDRADRYRANAAALAAECATLEREVAARLAPLAGGAFLSFHASWGYFAADFGLRQFAVESGGREPGPADLARLIAAARSEGIRVLLVQPQFGSRAPERIAEATGVALVPADDLASDWMAEIRSVASALASAHARSRD